MFPPGVGNFICQYHGFFILSWLFFFFIMLALPFLKCWLYACLLTKWNNWFKTTPALSWVHCSSGRMQGQLLTVPWFPVPWQNQVSNLAMSSPQQHMTYGTLSEISWTKDRATQGSLPASILVINSECYAISFLGQSVEFHWA